MGGFATGEPRVMTQTGSDAATTASYLAVGKETRKHRAHRGATNTIDNYSGTDASIRVDKTGPPSRT